MITADGTLWKREIGEGIRQFLDILLELASMDIVPPPLGAVKNPAVALVNLVVPPAPHREHVVATGATIEVLNTR